MVSLLSVSWGCPLPSGQAVFAIAIAFGIHAAGQPRQQVQYVEEINVEFDRLGIERIGDALVPLALQQTAEFGFGKQRGYGALRVNEACQFHETDLVVCVVERHPYSVLPQAVQTG